MQAVTVTAEGGEGGFWATAAPIIPHPLEFFFGLACFAILYYIVAKAVVPRLEQIYAERTAAIEGGMNKAEEAQAQAQAALEQYQAQLVEARLFRDPHAQQRPRAAMRSPARSPPVPTAHGWPRSSSRSSDSSTAGRRCAVPWPIPHARARTRRSSPSGSSRAR